MSTPSSLPLSDWNWSVLMLTQALLGVISPNFRMVELAFEGERWVVRVTLKGDSPEDREQIEEACSEMSDGLELVRDRMTVLAYTAIVSDVIVSKQPIYLRPVSEPRVVFRMRED